MKAKSVLILSLIVCLSFINGEAMSASTETEQQAPEAKPEQATQWLWGEVASVDLLNKSLVVKYLDYETDSDKEAIIAVDDKTVYENIKAIDELRARDTVSIDYTAGPGGNNIAKNISVEKAEAIKEEQTLVQNATAQAQEPSEEPKAVMPPSVQAQ